MNLSKLDREAVNESLDRLTGDGNKSPFHTQFHSTFTHTKNLSIGLSFFD